MNQTEKEIKAIIDSMYDHMNLNGVDEYSALSDAMELIKHEVRYKD